MQSLDSPKENPATLLLEGKYTRLRRTRHGLMQYFIHDRYVGNSLDLLGEFSESEVALFSEVIDPGDVVVEVGANIGSHTVFLGKAVGEQGRVLAFEPQRHVFQVLNTNIALNEQWHVETYHCGLGSKPGKMAVRNYRFDEKRNMGGLSLLPSSTELLHEKVDIRTLDSFSLQKLALLKVDVEGMEREVLEGAKDTILRCRPVLYVENDREEKSAALIEAIFALNYNVWWHLAIFFNSDNFAENSIGNPEWSNMMSINLFCLPKEWDSEVHNMTRVESVHDHWYRDGMLIAKAPPRTQK